jgi:hypothetical protein
VAEGGGPNAPNPQTPIPNPHCVILIFYMFYGEKNFIFQCQYSIKHADDYIAEFILLTF